MTGVGFVTAADQALFPAALATVNSVLEFQPDAHVVVLCDKSNPLTPPQRRCFSASDRVVLADWCDSPAAHPGVDAKALWAKAILAAPSGYNAVVWLEPGFILCSPVDDVVERCKVEGTILGSPTYAPSAGVCAMTVRNLERLARPAAGAEISDQVDPLDDRLWSQRGSFWDSMIDFRHGRFVNVRAGGQTQRGFHCADFANFWVREHCDRVLDGHSLQTYPYVWFLTMLWFGRCADWSVDPAAYLPMDARHLFTDLVQFLPQVFQVHPRARYRWNALSDAMIDRAIDGVHRMLTLGGGGMTDVIRLVDAHPWIRRYVEVGSYEGGSILTLGLRFLNRDIHFYSVESFMGGLDGTVDGWRLPSRKKFVESLSREPPGAGAERASSSRSPAGGPRGAGCGQPTHTHGGRGDRRLWPARGPGRSRVRREARACLRRPEQPGRHRGVMSSGLIIPSSASRTMA